MLLPPLSLYIHVPWCVRKCPYCDFNSHEPPRQSGQAGSGLPEQEYVAALLKDMEQDLPQAQGRKIHSVFIGGGTPSLFSPQAYEQLFAGLRKMLRFAADVEITLEANPGTVEQEKFHGYRAVGINRLSIGVQSFDPEKLKALGRIHGQGEAVRAAEAARVAGFATFNLDLMHGLPGQSLEQALDDLRMAISLKPTHLSWYQLTLEPNTVFYRQRPVLPDDDTLWAIQEAGQALLEAAGYGQYEVSAYALAGHQCRHNLNYWEFGDYLAIGAGAHGKIMQSDGSIQRYWKTRLPRDYLLGLEHGRFTAGLETVAREELPFEFMMNALRLRDGVPLELFARRTGLVADQLAVQLAGLRQQGLLDADADQLRCTPLGFRHLNRLLSEFLGG
jgi:oxygen-independent coproporphyrinogen-3 oxidase